MSVGAPQRKKRPTTLRLLTVAGAVMLLTSGFIFLGLVEAFQLRSMYRMGKHGARADGLITGKTKDHGGNLLYSFQVDGHVYSGRGGMKGGIERVRMGDHVSVLYDPENPKMSSLVEGDQQFWESIEIFAGGSVLFGILCTFFYTGMWYVWKQKRMNEH